MNQITFMRTGLLVQVTKSEPVYWVNIFGINGKM